MQMDGWALAPQEASSAHDRSAGADTGDERVGVEPLVPQLRPNLRPGRQEVRLRILLVGELTREERTRRRCRELLGEGDGSEETTLVFRDQPDRRAERTDEGDALRAHPVGHEDGHRVSEGAANST